MNLFRLLIAACAVLLLVDLVNLALHFFHHHGKFRVEELPNFYGFFGLIACVLLAVLSLGLRKKLMRKEDFYDNDVD
jgi:hypothetical protein